jgi:death-on-curing protein
MTRYLTTGDVLAIGEEIGTQGSLRDFGLLDPAVGRPQASMFGQDAYPAMWQKAAALMHSIIANHPFVDGNKRVGLTVALAFLSLNDVETEPLDEAAAYDLTISVATGKLSEVSATAAELRLLLPG